MRLVSLKSLAQLLVSAKLLGTRSMQRFLPRMQPDLRPGFAELKGPCWFGDVVEEPWDPTLPVH